MGANLQDGGGLGTSQSREKAPCTWLQSSAAFFHEQNPLLWPLPPRGYLFYHEEASYNHQKKVFRHYQ